MTVSAADRLRDIESLTHARLAHLGTEELLSELLDRALEALGADTAAVLLLDPAGDHLVATAARGLEEEVYQGVRIPLGAGFAGRVAATKRPVAIDDVATADVVNPILRDRVRSLLGAPLVVAGQLLGVLHVGTTAPRRFIDADVDLLQVVADRVALAASAHIAEGERKAAMALQRSLLPDRLPTVAGLETALRYSAGGGGDVGGDWYDMFLLPSQWICITVGDVVGRGLHAAVIMGRLRSALRAYALTSPADPATILQRADHKLQHFEPGEMATAIVALIEPSLDRLHVSLAGHPAPVMARPDGPGRYVRLPVDPPLGVAESRHRRTTTIDLPAGAVAAFYTDGLIERRRIPLNERLDLLCDTVRAQAPDPVCTTVMGALVGQEPPADDIALLVIRRTPPTATSPLEMTYPAVASSLGKVRAGLRRWLDAAGATPADKVNLVLAVGEATSNVVEHAYGPVGGPMTIRLSRDHDLVTVTVSDNGHWRAPRGTDRGRGNHIMAAATDRTQTNRRPTGTDVALHYRLGKEPPP